MDSSQHPVAVLGAGAVGLAAAANLAGRGIPFVVFEAGDAVGPSISEWAHVGLFSPWAFDLDPASMRLLDGTGWEAPALDEHPTGGDLVDRYLVPLATVPAIAAALRLQRGVVSVTRDGVDRIHTAGREAAPFVVTTDGPHGIERTHASAVIDATGTWTMPNPLGADGRPAIGEGEVRRPHDGGVTLVNRDGRAAGPFDRIVSATGFRPDLTPLTELRVDVDPSLESARALAPSIDPNVHSCGSVPSHGARELAHPEPGFYVVGTKSYGRAPTFLLATGYEQVRSVVAELDGDHEAAADVRLILPETGACSASREPAEATVGASACCG